MPPRDQARDSLNRRRSQVSDTLKNGISAALGGAVDANDLILSANDEQKIMDIIAKHGEDFIAKIMAQKKAEMDQAKAEARAAALKNFGAPSRDTANANSFGGPADRGSQPKNQKLTPENSTNNNSALPENGAGLDTPAAEQGRTPTGSRKSPLGEDPIEETTNEHGVTTRKYANDMESISWDGGKIGDGLQHCPYDGQILNPDGTCPAGDHNALGPEPKANGQTPPPIPEQARNGQTPPPIPPQARGRNTPPPIPPQARNPNTPPPIPPAVIAASIQAEGNKKMADLNKKLEAAKKELKDLKGDSEKTESKGWWLRFVGGCGCITIVLPIIAAIFLFLNYEKKSKIKKEINRVEEQITSINKERTETAKKYNLKI